MTFDFDERSKFAMIFIATLIIIAGGAYAANSYRANSTTITDIVEHNVGKRVHNNCTGALFIPTKTAVEWASFYNNKPSCVTLQDIYTIEYLVVGAGGSGGNGECLGPVPCGKGGGGGGGGDVISSSATIVDGGSTLSITVASSTSVRGGSGGQGIQGGTSSLSGQGLSVSAIGGGGGGASNGGDDSERAGGGGASGGGGGGADSLTSGGGGSAGFNGGFGTNAGGHPGGGGGGDTANGGNGGQDTGGVGGAGRSSSITGSSVSYGSGGNGGVWDTTGASGSTFGGGGGGSQGSNLPTSALSGNQGVVYIRHNGTQKGNVSAGGSVSCIGGGSPPNCVTATLYTFSTAGAGHTFTP